MSVGIIASSVVTSAAVDVLLEPFNNLTAWTQGGSPAIIAGRTGTAVELVGTGDTVTYPIAGGSQSDTLTVGFAYRITNIAAGNRHPLTVQSAGATAEVTLRITTAGAIAVLRGSPVGTVIGTSATGVFTINTWYYLELQTKLHDTAGTATVRVNETPVLTLTNVDTKVASATVFAAVQLPPPGSAVTALTDDLYITSGAGAAFKGNITV